MGERWNGLKMIAVALLAIIFVGRLLFHIASLGLVLVVLLALLLLVFYAGTRTLLRKQR